MTALRMSLTLVAMFVGSLGAALGLYAAVFMGVHDDIDPFLRDLHQQSEWAAWAAGARGAGPLARGAASALMRFTLGPSTSL